MSVETALSSPRACLGLLPSVVLEANGTKDVDDMLCRFCRKNDGVM